MTQVVSVAAPDKASNDYQFFRNEETGSVWKAKIVVQETRGPIIPDPEVKAAPGQIAVNVTVSPVDEAGKALRVGDRPVIIDAYGWTFTDVEMAEPGFDPAQRIANIVAERIALGEVQLTGHKKIHSFLNKWQKPAKLSLKGNDLTLAPNWDKQTAEGDPS